MQHWNVVVSLHERQYVPARKLLEKLGTVSRTAYFNVLVMHVENTGGLLETLRQWAEENPHILTMLARVVPVTQTFTFQTMEEFETKARTACLRWVAELRGKSFHVRLHRRGFKGRLSSQHEEGLLAGALMEALEQSGSPGRITFADPDAVIAVETVDCQGGLSLWTRQEMQRYAFLHLE